jgi:serine/threonine protein kinase
MSDAPSDRSGNDPRQEAEQLYVEFLGSDEASLTDGFERLAQRHPRLEGVLRSLHAEFENLERVLDEAAASPEFPFEELSRLHARGGHKRYRIEGEIARGGQGAVMRIWDSDLKRHLAMKLTLGRVTSSSAGDGASPTPGSSTPPLDSRTIHRFLNEAKITGQLDHPGIVPIHELGVDDDGQAYFTMKLVKGHSLHEIFHRHRQGDPKWTTQRCVSLLLKATEAVAYAHSKGIIHRDLKPANIMVGEYGEVYVMDWGMARVLGPGANAGESREGAGTPSESAIQPLVTQEGGVFGTPAYMPPEQARGEVSKLDERSDVYALGAVLYELLAGHAPYKDLVDGPEGLRIIGMITDRAPTPVDAIAESAHPELVAIANKAMERRRESRYISATDLLNDIRAHFEGRVVSAYEFGVIPELRKWVRRNGRLAAAIALTVSVTLAAVVAVGASEVKRAESDRMRLAEAEVATMEDQVLRVHNGLFRPFPMDALNSNEAEYWEGWLDDVESASARLDQVRLAAGGADWGQIRATAAGSLDPDDPNVARAQMQRIYVDAIGDFPLDDRTQFTAEEARIYREAAEVFAGSATYLEDVQLVEASLLRRFVRVNSREQREEYLLNAWAGMKGMGRRGLDAKIQVVRTGLSTSPPVDAPEFAGTDAWEECLEHLADPVRSPRYAGLRLNRNSLLEPLGYNTASQLWEFWMPTTGARPEPNPGGGWAVEAGTALVLVLIPGGQVRLGVQGDDPGGDRFQESPLLHEVPVLDIGRIDPFFISKYEMTQ